jgi:hypothetical protein
VTEEELEKVVRLTEELDKLVPARGAYLSSKVMGGGPDESRLVGNQLGYLRLGIELIKGGLPPVQDGGATTVKVGHLFQPDSEIIFHDFLRSETLFDPHEARFKKIALATGCAVIAVGLILLAVIGAVVVIKGLF